jgi:hypothetical protein
MASGTSSRRIFRERTGSTSPARHQSWAVEDPNPDHVLVPRELFERALALVRERRVEAEELHAARGRVKFLEGQLAAYRVSALKAMR